MWGHTVLSVAIPHVRAVVDAKRSVSLLPFTKQHMRVTHTLTGKVCVHTQHTYTEGVTIILLLLTTRVLTRTQERNSSLHKGMSTNGHSDHTNIIIQYVMGFIKFAFMVML